MIRRLSAALGGLLIFATHASAEPGQTLRSSEGSARAFRDCFIASQEAVGRPWAFVPDENGRGGRLSTVSDSGGYAPYTLMVRDEVRGSRIALSGEAPVGFGPMISAAVDACLTHSPTRRSSAR